MNFKKHIRDVTEYFQEFGNERDALAQKKYMKGHFDFCGIKTPQRRKIQKEMNALIELSPSSFLEFARNAYASPYRDLHHYAVDTISTYKKNFDEGIVSVIEFLITNNSWWDTVDGTNSFISKHYFMQNGSHHEEIVLRWMKDENMWLRRSALISQLKFKEDTDEKLMRKMIEANLGSKEFFINKAIGWSLREYSRTNPDFVLEFCETYILDKLSRREALRLIM